jgi:hypothetical protein
MEDGEQPREHLEPWKIRVRVSTTNDRGGAFGDRDSCGSIVGDLGLEIATRIW